MIVVMDDNDDNDDNDDDDDNDDNDDDDDGAGGDLRITYTTQFSCCNSRQKS